jgi:hypothetical protein
LAEKESMVQARGIVQASSEGEVNTEVKADLQWIWDHHFKVIWHSHKAVDGRLNDCNQDVFNTF